MTRAAVYLRISQDPTGEQAGVTRQREDCLALVEAQGWELLEVFQDNDISASSGKARPEYQRMLKAIRDGMVDAVGLGRMVLSYPDMPADVLAGAPLKTRLLCRTFSDCTTGPRNGLVSGCYPLDPFYTKHPQHATLKELKKKVKAPEPT